MIYHQSLCGPFLCVLFSTSDAWLCKRRRKGRSKSKTGRLSTLQAHLIVPVVSDSVLDGFSSLASFEGTLSRLGLVMALLVCGFSIHCTESCATYEPWHENGAPSPIHNA